MQYFVYQMPKFPVEILFPRDETWHCHETRRGIYMQWNRDVSMRRGYAH